MILLLQLLIFYNLTVIWNPCVSYYISSTPHMLRGKLLMLCEEIVIDATSKVQSVQHLRQFLYKTKQFQYGTIVYKIRYRFRGMIKLYRKALAAIKAAPVLDGNAEVNENDTYLDYLAQVDILAHEIDNLVSMIQVHHANRHADKSRAGYDLFFRRVNEAPVWLELAGSLDNNDNNDPPEPSPEDNNLTHTGKRRNGLWHYAVPIE